MDQPSFPRWHGEPLTITIPKLSTTTLTNFPKPTKPTLTLFSNKPNIYDLGKHDYPTTHPLYATNGFP